MNVQDFFVSSTTLKEWIVHSGAQTEALQRSENEVLFGGARGGGKTDAGLGFMVEPEYINHPGYRGLVIRKHSTDLTDWIARAKMFYGDLVEVAGKPAIFTFRAGGQILTGHLKDENAYEKYIGHEYQKMLVEELTQIRYEKDYEKLISSCRSIKHPELPAQCMSNCNPGGVGHAWVKRRFVDVANCKTHYIRGVVDGKPVERTRIFIPSTVDDNPTLMENDPSYVLALEQLPEQLRKAWRYGDWSALMGQYFTNFGKHLKCKPFMIEPHEAEGRLIGSMDYGYSLTGTSSFGLHYEHPSGVVYRVLTWSRTGLTGEAQADDLYEYLQTFPLTQGKMPCEVYCDHNMFVSTREAESTKSPITYFENRFGSGTKWIPANKQRVNGWAIVLNYFEPDPVTQAIKFFYFDKYNTTFENTMQIMIHDPNNPEDVLKCDEDHTADDARYGLVAILSRKTTSATKNKTKQAQNLSAMINSIVNQRNYDAIGR